EGVFAGNQLPAETIGQVRLACQPEGEAIVAGQVCPAFDKRGKIDLLGRDGPDQFNRRETWSHHAPSLRSLRGPPPGRAAKSILEPAVAEAVIAAAFLDPAQAAERTRVLVGIILVETGVKAGL